MSEDIHTINREYRERLKREGRYVDRRFRPDGRKKLKVDPHPMGPGENGGNLFNWDYEIAEHDALWDDCYAQVEVEPLDLPHQPVLWAHRLTQSPPEHEEDPASKLARAVEARIKNGQAWRPSAKTKADIERLPSSADLCAAGLSPEQAKVVRRNLMIVYSRRRAG